MKRRVADIGKGKLAAKLYSSTPLKRGVTIQDSTRPVLAAVAADGFAKNLTATAGKTQLTVMLV
jgi:hypothetical protein